MTIRPEQVQLLPAPAGANCLPGRVLSARYGGTHTRFKVEVANESESLMLESIAVAGPLEAGAEVAVHLPAEHVWLLPAGEG